MKRHHPQPQGPEPSPEEKDALRRVRLKKIIPAEMQQRLIKAKLVDQKLGGLVLTLNGQMWDATS